MEMNTRLQVEHPVSEEISGQDFVEWQLRVASGEKLPKRQDELKILGHSIEARIYAEDPHNNFLPHPGKITYLRTPKHRDSEINPDYDVRVETGVRDGDTVTSFYDPMIAKLVVRGDDRNSALQKTIRALEEYKVLGIPTNIEFMQKVLKNKDFIKGDFDTDFINKHRDTLLTVIEETEVPPTQDLVNGVVSKILLENHEHMKQIKFKDPWNTYDNYRLNYNEQRTVKYMWNGKEVRTFFLNISSNK